MSQKRKHTIKLEIGKFYRVCDGSTNGHPGLIFQIDQNTNSFYAIITGSMTFDEFKKSGVRKGYVKLVCPTDNRVDISLVRKRPFVGLRDDYGDKEYPDMSFKAEDLKIIIQIQSKNPIKGKYYKKRQKIKPRG